MSQISNLTRGQDMLTHYDLCYWVNHSLLGVEAPYLRTLSKNNPMTALTLR